jgi:xanthine/uracil/vitamin C permease (AzgA family)
MKALLQSRKFWLAVFGLVQTVVLHYISVPQDIWVAIDVLVGVLIASIALEDAGQKSAGL